MHKGNTPQRLPKCLICLLSQNYRYARIRGFGIVDMDKQEIGDYFPEFFCFERSMQIQ